MVQGMKFTHIRNKRGITLLNVIFLFVLIGVLAVASLKMYGSLVTQRMTRDVKGNLDNEARLVIAWSLNNKRLPASGSEFNSIFGSNPPVDAWGNQVVYKYADSAMTVAPTTTGNNICGRTSTPIYYSNPTNYVAFALLSAGSSSSTPGTVWPTLPASPGTALTIQPGDVARIVTLSELQAKAGCAGVSLGYLRIVNNELPNACTSSSYIANLFGDGGVPTYIWSLVSSPPGWLTINASTGALTANTTTTSTAGTYPVTVQLVDSQSPTPTTVQRTYNLNVASCTSGGSGSSGGIDTTPPTPGAPNNTSATLLSQNVVTNSPGLITVVNNVLTFGYNTANGSACIWYPYNFPLPGKTMRAYWDFCFANIDSSANSTTYADGYTFTLMQGSNPTSYCGTGTTYNAVTNPYFNCANNGALGEFLSYCGIPGQSIATEFDIFPSGSRSDPAGNYNHVAVVKTQSTHSNSSGNVLPSGVYGDNTHGMGDNPACTNGTVASSGCIFGPSPKGVTWLESGCNTNKNDHNARVEVHSRCNNTCSSCELNSCVSGALNSFIKVWIDKGNNNLTSNEATAPDLSFCAPLNAALSQFKVGFTQATGGISQLGYISNFIMNSYGSCSQATISPQALPDGRVGSAYSQQMTATGGTPPYTWSLSASNISGVAASTLPPGSPAFAISSSGLITGTPTTPGIYNAVLVSMTDSCTSDVCSNTVSSSYTLGIGCNSYTVYNKTGSTKDFSVPTGTCKNNIANAGIITSTLTTGQVISCYATNSGTCTQTVAATITFDQIAAADTNHTCSVNINSGYTLTGN